MNKLILLLTVLFFSIPNLYSIEKPKYQIAITHGDSVIGNIKIQLFPDVAPQHCRNFDSLVSIGFYNGTAFHRVIPNFMIQGGDPNSINKDKSTWGYGDPSQRKIPAEFSNLKHIRGILSAARATDPNSATSQFFICVTAYPSLDGKYSIYGEVTDGMNIVDYIVKVPRDAKDNPINKVSMIITKLEVNDIEDNNVSLNSFSISPNPASDYVEISLDSPFFKGGQGVSLEIYNFFGEKNPTLALPVWEGTGKVLPNGEDLGGVFKIDISNLTPGVYFIKFGDKFEKFVKM